MTQAIGSITTPTAKSDSQKDSVTSGFLVSTDQLKIVSIRKQKVPNAHKDTQKGGKFTARVTIASESKVDQEKMKAA